MNPLGHDETTCGDYMNLFRTSKILYDGGPTGCYDTCDLNEVLRQLCIKINAGAGYTDEQAQDAVGSILNTSEFVYNDGAGSISINQIHWNKIVGAPTGNDSNFANTDLTATAHRTHNWNALNLTLQSVATFTVGATSYRFTSLPTKALETDFLVRDDSGFLGYRTLVLPEDTDNVAEGTTNLYYTDTRVYQKVKQILQESGILDITANDGAQTLTLGATEQYQGTLTDVTLTTPSALNVVKSGTTALTFALSGAGTTAQYIRGDGSLATFPTVLTSIDHTHSVYNDLGQEQFTFGVGQGIRFQGSGTTSISYVAGTRTVIIESAGGSEGDGNNYTTDASFNTANDGVLTLTRNGLTDLNVDLDGRYQLLDGDLTAIATLSDSGTGFLKKTAANTWSLDTATYLTSLAHSHTVANSGGASQFTFTEGQEVRFTGGSGLTVGFVPANREITFTSANTFITGGNFNSSVTGGLRLTRNDSVNIDITGWDGRYLLGDRTLTLTQGTGLLITSSGATQNLSSNPSYTLALNAHLRQLSDVVDNWTGSLTTGQLLRYNGTLWENWTPDYLTTLAHTHTFKKNGAVDSFTLGVGETVEFAGANGTTITFDTTNKIITISGSGGADGNTFITAGSFNVAATGTLRLVRNDATNIDITGWDARYMLGDRTLTLSSGTGITVTGGTQNLSDSPTYSVSLNANLNHLTDVTIGTGPNAPTTGHLLRYNTATTQWENWAPNFITSLAHTHTVANSLGTAQFTFAEGQSVQFAASGGAGVLFDAPTRRVTFSAPVDTNYYVTSGTFNVAVTTPTGPGGGPGVLRLTRSDGAVVDVSGWDGRYVQPTRTITLAASTGITVDNGTQDLSVNRSWTIGLNAGLHTLNDVTLGGIPLADGHMLKYDLATTQWINFAPSFLTSLAHNHGVANSVGTQQFTFGVGDNLRFAAGGAASVDFVVNTKTVTISAPTQVKADWNQIDPAQFSYIQNKPTIPSVSGTNGYLTRFTSATALGNSLAFEDLGNGRLGWRTTSPVAQLHIEQPSGGGDAFFHATLAGDIRFSVNYLGEIYSKDLNDSSGAARMVTTLNGTLHYENKYAFSNVGSGAGTLYKQIAAGNSVQLKTLKAGSGVTLTNNTDDVTVSTSGPQYQEVAFTTNNANSTLAVTYTPDASSSVGEAGIIEFRIQAILYNGAAAYTRTIQVRYLKPQSTGFVTLGGVENVYPPQTDPQLLNVNDGSGNLSTINSNPAGSFGDVQLLVNGINTGSTATSLVFWKISYMITKVNALAS